MSKRLRASMRAANKARNLRPRSQNRSSAPPSSPMSEDREQQTLQALGAELEDSQDPEENLDAAAEASMRPSAPAPEPNNPILPPEMPEPISSSAEAVLTYHTSPSAEPAVSTRRRGLAEIQADARMGDAVTIESAAPMVNGEVPRHVSSLSGQFFHHPDEPAAPPKEEAEDDALVVSPALLARRARLRRIVAGVVGVAGVLSIAAVAKMVGASKRSPLPTPVVDAAHVVPNTTASVKVEPATLEVKKIEPTAVPPVKPEPAQADQKKPEEPSKAEEKNTAPSGGDPVALRKETERLLNLGKRKEAIEKAREAIAADPMEAMGYLFLGSALQDSGNWKEAHEAYSECVRKATRGPINECRAMGGRK